MKITAIVEDPHGNAVEIVIDDTRTYVLTPPVPRADLADAAASIAEMAGYRLDCHTLELWPIDDLPQTDPVQP